MYTKFWAKPLTFELKVATVPRTDGVPRSGGTLYLFNNTLVEVLHLPCRPCVSSEGGVKQPPPSDISSEEGVGEMVSCVE